MRTRSQNVLLIICLLILIVACSKESYNDENQKDLVNVLPLVIHVIHNGEAIGEGFNLSFARIKRQVEILNDDFRRKEATNGHNTNPNSEDSRIEFVLAKRNLKGIEFNGINRIDASSETVENLGYNQNHYAQYDYWDPSQYINIWLTPLSEEFDCIVLGLSAGPLTDLPGTELLSIPQVGDAEGILINTTHFGVSNVSCHANLGRTLTHEMGHYLGLQHLWGDGVCSTNDFCADTPAVDIPVFGNIPFTGCNGEPVMISNYMNFSHDVVMNTFTKNQIERMHYVLANHTGRKTLLTSSAL